MNELTTDLSQERSLKLRGEFITAILDDGTILVVLLQLGHFVR